MTTLPKRSQILSLVALIGLAAYLIFGIVAFIEFVKPSLEGANDWRSYGDSGVYMQTAEYIRSEGTIGSLVAILSPAQNLLLPALIGLALPTPACIAAFDWLVFLTALVLLAKTFSPFKWYIFLPIILASGTTFEALLTLNKEVFAFLSAALLARWLKTRSRWLALFLIAISFALRWEQALALIVFFAAVKLKIRPKHAALAIVSVISVLYPVAYALVMSGIPDDLKQSTSSTLYEQLNRLQGYGFYFVLVVPKLVIATVSQLVRFWQPFVDPVRLHDLNNGVFVLLDQFCFCLVGVGLWFNRRCLRGNMAFYFALVYGLIFLAAPVNQPRYLYMVFVLLTALISSPGLQSIEMTFPPTKVRFRFVGCNLESQS